MNDATKLLLLVDLQQGFLQSNDTRQIVAPVVKLTRIWQRRGWPIVCSRFVNLPDSNWQRLRDWHSMQGEPNTTLIPELGGVTPYVLKKSTYSAWSTEVGAVCVTHGAREVIIAGVDTNECVLATALAVFDAGLTPWIVQDACASSGGAKPHAMAIELLSALLGERQVVDAASLE